MSRRFTSDAILNAPDVLYYQHVAFFRSRLLNGTVITTTTLLACAFVPLLKSCLKDPGDPHSYRAIVGSSLIVKLFEKTVLLIWREHLSSDSLQF